MEYRDRDMLEKLGKQALEEWRLTNLIRLFEAMVGNCGGPPLLIRDLQWVEVAPVYNEIRARLELMPNGGDLR